MHNIHLAKFCFQYSFFFFAFLLFWSLFSINSIFDHLQPPLYYPTYYCRCVLVKKPFKTHCTSSQSSSSSKTGSQPMQIPEIPPFVKKAHQQSTMSLVSHIPSQFQQPRHSDAAAGATTTKIPEIPPYDPSVPKRSKDWTPLPIDVSCMTAIHGKSFQTN